MSELLLKADTFIGENAPKDGREWDCQCARCGSSMFSESCGSCGGDGYFECYEDDPLWYSPGDTKPCDACRGEGGFLFCGSDDGSEWCKNHPNEERENIAPSTPEWFTFESLGNDQSLLARIKKQE
jgi:hypothetical protein